MRKAFLATSTALIATLIVFLLLGQMVTAQSVPNLFTGDDVVLKMTPRIPGPFEEVEGFLESFSFELDTSYISWRINGQAVAQGVGKTRHTFTMKGPNEPIFLEIQVQSPLIGDVVKRVQLTPASVDLLWEAPNSYVPPFYKGKPLPASEATLHVVAVPHDIADNQNYVYTWRNNGTVDQKASGFKKNSFTMRNNFFSERFIVEADVSSRNGAVRAEQLLSIPRFDPKIMFEVQRLGDLSIYPDSPDHVNIAGEFNTLVAHPLYLSTPDGQRHVDFEWVIDGEVFQNNTGSTANAIPLVAPVDTVGFSDVRVRASHRGALLQDVQSAIRVFFGN